MVINSSVFYKAPQQVSANGISLSKFKYVKLNIKGMSCDDCIKHIDGSLMGISGVATSSTSLKKRKPLSVMTQLKRMLTVLIIKQGNRLPIDSAQKQLIPWQQQLCLIP